MNQILRSLGLITLLISFYSCATKPNQHEGSYASADGGNGKRLKTGLTISGRELNKFTSKHFTIVEVMIENYTNDWIDMDEISVSFGNDILDKQMKVVKGKNLRSWADAMDFRIEKRWWNRVLKSKKSKKVGLPKDHLLSGNFRIPPGVAVKRWVTLYLKTPFKSPYFKTLKMKYKVAKTKEEATIRIRGQKTRSNFQWAHPES